MKSKVVIGLIIVGIIFLGSATYALFNENLLLNDVASDIQTNDTTQSNNQSNIQNNQSNTILNSENLNFTHYNNVANVVLNDIGNINGDVGQKVVKEVSRRTVDNKTLVEFDDSSFLYTVNDHTYHIHDVLTIIYDVDSVSGGYIDCPDCGKFIPVGDVSGLVPEDYLCDCGAYVIGKNVPWVYSEESVLEDIKYTETYYRYNARPVDNPFDVPSTNIDSMDSNVSDEVPQDNIENTDSQSIDYSRFDLIEVPQQEHQLMDWSYEELPYNLFEM